MAEFDIEAGDKYIYPTNYPIRKYQFDIVKAALFKNTLVCLPTGLGKTFIGAVLMYNFYRWYPTGKIVFLAPTRPLVAQQIEACFHVMGIPQEHTTEMTGTTAPDARQLLWKNKRIFFLTPQVLMNDLSRGACPVRVIKLIVIDEAHKALGNHSFCQVMKQMKQQCYNFRVVALSATPGSDIQAVQQVISNLMISHIELRDEDNPEIMQYTHERKIEKEIVPIDGELKKIVDKYLQILKYYVFKLIDHRVLYTKDETTVTKFMLLKAREAFRQDPPAGFDRQTIGLLEGTFALCMTLYHAYELLLMHSIRAFYRFLKEIWDVKKGGGNFYSKGELRRNTLFMELMKSLETHYEKPCEDHVETNISTSPNHKVSRISHPKMEKLQHILLSHFTHYQEKNESTRVMVFSHYRDSAIEITELLRAHEPLIKPMSFLGQSVKAGKGITQKEQMQVIKQFRTGNYNTLVSTCVGEEGLDIGEVDLIVCYDVHKSPIRLVQRMGRTGRKRDGRIVFLMTQGKEEKSYLTSQYQKKSLTKALLKGDKLTRHLFPNSPRMIPAGIDPACLKLEMVERTYNPAKQRTGRMSKGTLTSYLIPRSAGKGVGCYRLNESEMKVYEEKYKTDFKSIRRISRPSFGLCEKKLKESEGLIVDIRDDDERRVIDLSHFQPWYTTLQSCHEISHSKATSSLVHLSDFINIQTLIGDNDNYSMEMAPFLQKYLQDCPSSTDQTMMRNSALKEAKQSRLDSFGHIKRRTKKPIRHKGVKNNKQTSKTGIESFLIKADCSSSVAKSEIKPQASSSNKNFVHFDLSVDSECSADGQSYRNIDSEVEILDQSDLKDFELPAVGRTTNVSMNEKHLHATRTFLDIENIFSSYSSKEKEKVSFTSPPVFCNARLKTSFFRPSSVSKFNEYLNEKGVLCMNLLLGSYFKRFSLSELLKQNTYSFPITLKNDIYEKFANYHPVSSTSNDIEVVDLEPPELDNSIMNISRISNISNKNISPKPSISIVDSGGHSPTDLNDPHLIKFNSECDANEQKSPTESSVLLTPPPASSVTSPKTLQHCTSPYFSSRRPTWIEDSPLIVSSTPVTSKAKRLFGNSSINITPISLDTKVKFSSVQQNEQEKLKKGTVFEHFSPNLRKDNLKLNGQHQSKNKLNEEKNKNNVTEVNFELSLDDELFANIDLESIAKNFSQKTSSKEFPKVNEDHHRKSNDSNAVEVKGNEMNVKKEKDKSFMTVTQIIDFVSGPDCASSKTCAIPNDGNNLRLKHSFSPPRLVRGMKNQRSIDKTTTVADCNRNVPKRKLYDNFQTNCNNKTLKEIDIDFGKDVWSSNMAAHDTKAEEKPPSPRVFTSRSDVVHSSLKAKEQDTEVHFSFGLDGFEDILDDDFPHTIKEGKEYAIGNDSEDMFKDFDTFSKIKKKGNDSDSRNSEMAGANPPKSSPGSSRQFISTYQSPNNHSPISIGSVVVKDNLESESKNTVLPVSHKNENNVTKKLCLSNIKPSVDHNETRCPDSNSHKSLVMKDHLANGINDTEYRKSESKLRSKRRSRLKTNSDDRNEEHLGDSPIIRRKKTAVNLLDSRFDENLSDVNRSSKNNSTSGSSRKISYDGTNIVDLFSDDDFEVPFALKAPDPKRRHVSGEKDRRRRTNKKEKQRLRLVEMEAGVVDDSVICISSDESESSLDEYDSSFVDDEDPQTQQKLNVDMKAVYLQSVRSPLKKTVKVGQNNHLNNDVLDQTDKYLYSESEEEEDSFVVENDFVEYETQFPGETMMAVDPIIHEELENMARKKQLKKHPPKRRRIALLSDSSDDDENLVKKPKVSVTPLKVPVSSHLLSSPDQSVAHPSLPETKKSEASGTAFATKMESKKVVETTSHVSSDSLFDKDFRCSLPANDALAKSLLSNRQSVENSPSQVTNLYQTTVSSHAFKNALPASHVGADGPQKELITSSFKNTEETSPKLGTKRKLGYKSLSYEHPSKNVPVQSTVDGWGSAQKKFRSEQPSFISRQKNTLPSYSTPTSAMRSVVQALPRKNSQCHVEFSLDNSLGTTKASPTLMSNSRLSSIATTSDGFQHSNEVCIVVDTTEVSIAGMITSTLRLTHKAQTFVWRIAPASYIISCRTAVFRQNYSSFANSMNRSRLIAKLRILLHTYDRVVIIIEKDPKLGYELPPRTLYMDSISCACAQIPQLQVLQASNQEETADIIWNLARKETLKGYSIPSLFDKSEQFTQDCTFYQCIPKISSLSALLLAHSFRNIKEAINSDVNQLKTKGRLSTETAAAFKSFFTRPFRKDFLRSSLNKEST